MDASQDIEELNRLLLQCKRPRVQELLKSEIAALEKTLPKVEKAAAVPDVVLYTTLDSLSWEQDDEKVKIYISLEGASPDKTIPSFHEWSFEVKVHDVGGRNYRCGVIKLNKAIDPERSTVVVKPKRLIITLKKKAKSQWSDLRFKEDKLKARPEDGKDPMSGIMDLMKNMYEDGDDDMKRTIAQAWGDARAGKKAAPFGA